MTTIQVKVPDGTDISGYEAVFRLPVAGELIIDDIGQVSRTYGIQRVHRIVLKPKWKPPEWLKPGWIAKDEKNCWCWFSDKPAWSSAHRWWYQMKDAERSMDLPLTNFQGPDVEPKDSLIEITG